MPQSTSSDTEQSTRDKLSASRIMGTGKPNGALVKLNDILQRQAVFIRGGELEKALALAPGLERLSNAVIRNAKAFEGRSELTTVLDRARQNAALIAAARDGVKAAQEMLDRPRETGFSGYNAQGQAFRVGR